MKPRMMPRLDGAHFAAALLDERGEVRPGNKRFAPFHDVDRCHGQSVVYQIDECCLIDIIPKVDGLVRPLEHHPEGPDEGLRRVQEHELRGRRRKESHHDDGGRHTGLGIKLECLNNAYGDGAEDDYAGEDRGQPSPMTTAAKLSHGSTVAHGPNTTSASATPQRI